MNIQENMRDKGTKKMTCEDALRRLEEARRLKREYVKELEKKMKEDFKKRTGPVSYTHLTLPTILLV